MTLSYVTCLDRQKHIYRRLYNIVSNTFQIGILQPLHPIPLIQLGGKFTMSTHLILKKVLKKYQKTFTAAYKAAPRGSKSMHKRNLATTEVVRLRILRPPSCTQKSLVQDNLLQWPPNSLY